MSTDFIREIEEDIRRDRWKRLWDRYGLLATAAVVRLVVGVAGWSVWRNLETQRAEAQTAERSRLIDRAATADAGTLLELVETKPQSLWRTSGECIKIILIPVDGALKWFLCLRETAE